MSVVTKAIKKSDKTMKKLLKKNYQKDELIIYEICQYIPEELSDTRRYRKNESDE